jgi:hypothetical protein
MKEGRGSWHLHWPAITNLVSFRAHNWKLMGFAALAQIFCSCDHLICIYLYAICIFIMQTRIIVVAHSEPKLNGTNYFCLCASGNLNLLWFKSCKLYTPLFSGTYDLLQHVDMDCWSSHCVTYAAIFSFPSLWKELWFGFLCFGSMPCSRSIDLQAIDMKVDADCLDRIKGCWCFVHTTQNPCTASFTRSFLAEQKIL